MSPCMKGFFLSANMKRVDPIVSVQWLAEVQASSSFRKNNITILDGSMHLPDANRDAEAEFTREHIPGALFFDINACADRETTLPHMLPKPQDFETFVGKLGINNNTHVVVYDTNDEFPIYSAVRVWWTFRVFGHEKVSLLEGGLSKWRKLGHPLRTAVKEVTEQKFTAQFNPRLLKNFEEVEANQYKEKTFDLFDTRPAEYYDGTAPSFMPGVKMGSIPGSINFPFPELMDVEHQTFKNKEELLKVFKRFSVDLDTSVVATCGSGTQVPSLGQYRPEFAAVVTGATFEDHPSCGVSWVVEGSFQDVWCVTTMSSLVVSHK